MNTNYNLQNFYYEVYQPHNSSIDVKTRDSRLHLMKEYVFPYIGSKPLDQIDAVQINSIYSILIEKGLSESTIFHINLVLRRVFTLASSVGIIPQSQNPCYYKRRRPPSSCRTVPHPQLSPVWYSLSELRRIEANLDHVIMPEMFRLVMHSGIKNDEFLALKISDYDPASKNLSINRIMRYLKRNSAKEVDFCAISEKSPRKRNIILSNPAREAIESAIESALARPSLPGEINANDRFIFRDERNRIISSSEIHFTAAIIKQAAGVDVLTFRTLRSNFIVMCFRSGWEEPEVMKYVGIALPQNVLPHKKVALATSRNFALS